MPKPSEELRAAMLAEIEAAMAPMSAPDYAMTFRELLATANVSETTLRDWLHGETSAGRWAKARRGEAVMYWKVAP